MNKKPLIEVSARKLGMGSKRRRVLVFKDKLEIWSSPGVISPGLLEGAVGFDDITRVDLRKGLASASLVLKKRLGRPVVIQAMQKKDASKVKTFIEKQLTNSN